MDVVWAAVDTVGMDYVAAETAETKWSIQLSDWRYVTSDINWVNLISLSLRFPALYGEK